MNCRALERAFSTLIYVIGSMILAILPVFGNTTIYVEAKTTMTIDSKVEDDDIRTEIEIDTPGATTIDESRTIRDDKVNIVIKSPNKDNGDKEAREENREAREENREAREKLQDIKDNADQAIDDLKDQPNSEPSEAAKSNIDDAGSDITEACEELDTPCSEPS